MTSPRRASKNGFTLIEMMVAMSILVILTGSLYACFVSVVDSAEIARSSMEGLRVQEFLREHFNNNLSAVHANPSGEYALIGEDESGAYGPADKLSITTTLPTSGALSLPGIVKTVEYKIDEPSFDEEGGFKTFTIDAPAEDEEMESVMMYITERPLILGEDGEGGDLFVDDEEGLWKREVPIRSLNFEYYDGTAEEWVEDWNSEELGMLPWAIRVSVNLAKSEAQLQADYLDGVGTDDDPDFSLIVVLPTGAGVVTPDFHDPNHARSGEFVDGGPGILDDAR